jgi:hypothetical protein
MIGCGGSMAREMDVNKARLRRTAQESRKALRCISSPSRSLGADVTR